MDSVTALVTSIASLVGALAWPVLILIVILKFKDSLGDFFRNLAEFTVKAPGIEATARRQQIEAAVAVGAASAKSSGGGSREEDPASVAARLVESLPDARSQRRLRRAVVLWVDDRPDNNRYERQALEAFGVRFALAASTDEALTQLQRQTFDLVISDMGRPPDRQAGCTLLDAMRARTDQTPYIIYAGSRDVEHVRQARAHGAIGATNSPQELIAMVTDSLRFSEEK